MTFEADLTKEKLSTDHEIGATPPPNPSIVDGLGEVATKETVTADGVNAGTESAGESPRLPLNAQQRKWLSHLYTEDDLAKVESQTIEERTDFAKALGTEYVELSVHGIDKDSKQRKADQLILLMTGTPLSGIAQQYKVAGNNLRLGMKKMAMRLKKELPDEKLQIILNNPVEFSEDEVDPDLRFRAAASDKSDEDKREHYLKELSGYNNIELTDHEVIEVLKCLKGWEFDDQIINNKAITILRRMNDGTTSADELKTLAKEHKATRRLIGIDNGSLNMLTRMVLGSDVRTAIKIEKQIEAKKIEKENEAKKQAKKKQKK